MKLQLTPAERCCRRGTKSPAAHDAYLRGLELLSKRRRLDVDSNLAAQAEFRKAADIYTGYAQAIAGLAWARWLYVQTISEFGATQKFSIWQQSLSS